MEDKRISEKESLELMCGVIVDGVTKLGKVKYKSHRGAAGRKSP